MATPTFVHRALLRMAIHESSVCFSFMLMMTKQFMNSASMRESSDCASVDLCVFGFFKVAMILHCPQE